MSRNPVTPWPGRDWYSGAGPSDAPGIEALGLEYARPARHVREYVTVLRALAEEGRVDFDGTDGRTHGIVRIARR